LSLQAMLLPNINVVRIPAAKGGDERINILVHCTPCHKLCGFLGGHLNHHLSHFYDHSGNE
jgi:hypothetical protein